MFPGEIHFSKPGECVCKVGKRGPCSVSLSASGEAVSQESEAAYKSVLSQEPGKMFMLRKKVNSPSQWLCRHSRKIRLTKIFPCVARWLLWLRDFSVAVPVAQLGLYFCSNGWVPVNVPARGCEALVPGPQVGWHFTPDGFLLCLISLVVPCVGAALPSPPGGCQKTPV